MPGLDIADGFGDIAERERAVDDRLELSFIDQVRQKLQVLTPSLHVEGEERLTHERREGCRLDDPIDGSDPATVGVAAAQDQAAPGGERRSTGGRRVHPAELEDEIVLWATLREIFLGIVDDVVRSE